MVNLVAAAAWRANKSSRLQQFNPVEFQSQATFRKIRCESRSIIIHPVTARIPAPRKSANDKPTDLVGFPILPFLFPAGLFPAGRPPPLVLCVWWRDGGPEQRRLSRHRHGADFRGRVFDG